jgi:uncharacterized protein
VFGRKQRDVEKQIDEYCETVMQCADAFKNAFAEYCAGGNYDTMKASFADVHRAESLADDIRREIEVLMYSQALFPESRGDILGLLETMDRVPNHMEACVQMVYEERIDVPDEYDAALLSLVAISCRAAEAMVDSVKKLFSNYTGAAVAVGRIDELETEADHIESGLKEDVFGSHALDGFHKILLKGLIKNLSGVADRAENVGDRIRIIVAKRGL